jgi:AcrR family transcriptional regulator
MSKGDVTVLTTENIVSGFKELIEEKPLSRITVSDICEKAGISRKTFYVHFADKNDLLNHIFFDIIMRSTNELRALLPSRELKSGPKLILEGFYKQLYDNRHFIEKFMKNGGQAQFQKIFIDVLSSENEKILSSAKMPEREREYMAYFYASSQALLVIKWINDKCPYTSNQMARYYYNWAMQYWQKSVFPELAWQKKP